MSTVVRVPPGRLGAVLRSRARSAPGVMKDGMFLAAKRGEAQQKSLSPVYDGQYKSAWRAQKTANGACLENDAPYAGVIESGARPHAVNREGVDAIREWVRKQLLGISASLADENAEVESITWAIVKRIAEKGQEGKHIVRDSLPKLREWARSEIERRLERNFSKPVGGSE